MPSYPAFDTISTTFGKGNLAALIVLVFRQYRNEWHFALFFSAAEDGETKSEFRSKGAVAASDADFRKERLLFLSDFLFFIMFSLRETIIREFLLISFCKNDNVFSARLQRTCLSASQTRLRQTGMLFATVPSLTSP